MPYTTGHLPFAPGSHTSWKSADDESRNPQRGAKVMRYLMKLREAGERGLTDHEAKIATVLPLQSITSIRNGLVKDGLVRREGERIGPYGKANTVWIYIGPEAQ